MSCSPFFFLCTAALSRPNLPQHSYPAYPVCMLIIDLFKPESITSKEKRTASRFTDDPSQSWGMGGGVDSAQELNMSPTHQVKMYANQQIDRPTDSQHISTQ